MPENNVVLVLQAIVGELRAIARSETIVGAPVTVGERTVVPISKITVGFGAGGGEGSRSDKSAGFGGGGGGGAVIDPTAFLVMDKDRVHLLTIRRQGAVDAILEAAPDILETIKNWSAKKPGSEQPKSP
ncbi:MAG: sporulation protein [candidate division Zixibacteria bacterium]|nr:sporulation protein [candidate division Zixibacteria bacterium]